MKKVLVLFLMFLPYVGISQSVENWQLGINGSPFYFGRSNSTAMYEKDQQNIPNGFALGFTLEKNWNSRWGIKTGIEYSIQNRKDVLKKNDQSTLDFHFDYFKFPLTLQFSKSLDEQKGLFLTFNQGFQTSFLIDYKTIFRDALTGRVILEPGNTGHYNKENELVHHSNPSSWDYEKVTFGLIGSIGLKKIISNNFSLSANLRYEYDLTDADNGPVIRTASDNMDGWEPKSTYNYRIGIEIGVQYHFRRSRPD